jgi:hypothetical protein
MHPRLQPFVDDELARAPLLLEEALHAALEATRQAAAPEDRRFSKELDDALNIGKSHARQRFVESLREQVQHGPRGHRGKTRLALSLVDEDAVAADIELSRTTQAIKDAAEHELRELRAFTSALVGDVHVAHDVNPLRPEVHAKALWAAAAALPLSTSRRVALMRHATVPFAHTLRRAYAAACTRLENAGVEPGSFRTIVEPTGKRMAVPLSQLRDTMPMPLDDEPSPMPLPALRSDRQAVALLSRLFDAMLADDGVAADVRVLVAHLHTLAVRVALRDPAALDSYAHPLWLFIDRINFVSELHPGERDPLRIKLMAFVRALLDGLLREAVPDADLFRRGLDRLRAFEQHLFELRRAAAEPAIEGLRSLADESAQGMPLPALDASALDTVPAMLLDNARTPRRGGATPMALVPGGWIRVYLDGRWAVSQLVWRDIAGSAWLLADVETGASWALAQSALDRLHADGLLCELAPRSMVQAAAQAVERGLGATTH